MFQRSKDSPPLTGGLPTFTPQRLREALLAPPRYGDTPEQDSVIRRPTPPSKIQINVRLDSVVRGALAVGEFLARRAANTQTAKKELEVKTLELAREYQGLLGVPDLLMRAECNPKQAEGCLKRLEKSSLCRYLCHYQNEALYAFPEYLPRMWECEYCASKYPVPQGTAAWVRCQCRGCGAMMSQSFSV